jgi:hypothetical protein
MSARELIEKEIATLPETLQGNVYDFALRLKKSRRDEAFNGVELSESVLARDGASPEGCLVGKYTKFLHFSRNIRLNNL